MLQAGDFQGFHMKNLESDGKNPRDVDGIQSYNSPSSLGHKITLPMFNLNCLIKINF